MFLLFDLFTVELEVEMELVVENYVFTEELKNKSSLAYKETKDNFTTEVKPILVVIPHNYLTNANDPIMTLDMF